MSAAWAAALGVACSGGDGRSGPPDAPGSSVGRLAVALTVPRVAAPTLRTSARLLRWRDLDGVSAATLAGDTTPELAAGQCVLVDGEALLDEALAAASPDSSVELLDAGEIVATVAGRSTRLLPRYLPEVLPFVTGVAYAVESVPEVESPDMVGSDVSISAFGGDDVGRFDATATLPPLPRLTAIGGRDPALQPVLEVSRSSDLDLEWTTGGRLGDDAVSVVLAWAGGEVRCRPAAAGRVRVAEAQLAAIPDGTEVLIAVERTVRSTFSAPGLEAGELDAAVRDAVTVKVW